MCHSSDIILINFIRSTRMKKFHRYGGWFQFVKFLKRNSLHINGPTTKEVFVHRGGVISGDDPDGALVGSRHGKQA